MQLQRREYRLGTDEYGVTLQASPSDFVRLEVYDGYFALTWSTKWSVREYSELARHVLDEANGKAVGAKLVVSRREQPRTEHQGSDAVGRQLDSLRDSTEATEFVRIDSDSPELEGVSLSWNSNLPSSRLRGAAIGFVGQRFSRSYVTKLLRSSATASIREDLAEAVDAVQSSVPSDLMATSGSE